MANSSVCVDRSERADAFNILAVHPPPISGWGAVNISATDFRVYD